MSTLIALVDAGLLVRHDPELGLGVLEERQIYMLERVPNQIQERIIGTTSDRQIETLPEEQLDALLADFCEGVEMMFDEQFKCLLPHENGVWELKTADVRLFGWFAAKDCFVATSVDAKWRIMESKLYRACITDAADQRTKLFGENAEYIKGTEPDDVISNWC